MSQAVWWESKIKVSLYVVCRANLVLLDLLVRMV